MTVTTIASIAAGLSRPAESGTAKAASVFSSILPRLGTDSRTNDSADIAATLALQNQTAQLRVASQNIAQSASLLASAEAGATAIVKDLGRLRDIAQRASSGDLSAAQREALISEFNAIRARIDSTARTTRFADESLLDGSSPQLKLAQANQALRDLSVNSLTDEALFKGAGLSLASPEAAKAAEGVLKQAQAYANIQLDNVRALQQGLDFAAATLETAIQNQEASASSLREDDFTLALLGVPTRPLSGNETASLLAQTNRLPANLLGLLGQ